MVPVQRKPDVFSDIEPHVENIRKGGKKWHRLNEDERLFILWGKSKGYDDQQIAGSIGRSRNTVRSYFHKVQISPLIIFDDRVYEILGKKRFKCRFCHDQRETEMRIQRHVLSHFVPYEIARDISLVGVRKAL